MTDFNLHELLKPGAGDKVTVDTGRRSVHGPMTFTIDEDDGDHIFRVHDVFFIEGHVRAVDHDRQIITLNWW